MLVHFHNVQRVWQRRPWAHCLTLRAVSGLAWGRGVQGLWATSQGRERQAHVVLGGLCLSSGALSSWGAEHTAPDGNRHSSQAVPRSPKGRRPPSRGQSTCCVPLQMKSHSCWLSGHNFGLRPSQSPCWCSPRVQAGSASRLCIWVCQGLQASLPRGSELVGFTSAPRLSSGQGVVGPSGPCGDSLSFRMCHPCGHDDGDPTGLEADTGFRAKQSHTEWLAWREPCCGLGGVAGGGPPLCRASTNPGTWLCC